MDKIAARMMALFRGLDGVHGTHGVPDKEGLKWGIKRTARTLRESVTEELWIQHLRGERPLGVVPICEDHTCVWGSIDVDQYDIDLLELVEKVERQGYPLVSCRSKSAGAHLFLFLADPQPASAVQGALRDIAATLGVAGSEIFPKQSQLLLDRGDAGSWMVMPYFGDTFEGRLREQVGLKRTGSEMSVEEFILAAEAMRLTGRQFDQMVHKRHATTVREVLPFEDGPRCMQLLAREGFTEGGRNSSLMMMGIYFKRKDPDGWKGRLDAANQGMIVPPLPPEEVESITRSLERRDYQYMCKQEPMQSHCDVQVCRGRRYGVGDEGSYPVISGISKLDIPDSPIWFVDIEDIRIELTTEQLQNYVLFQRVCMEKVNRTYRVLKQSDWIVMLGSQMVNMTVIEAPPDVGTPEAFREQLEEYLTNRAVGDKREDLLVGRPWHDVEAGRYYFKLSNFVTFLGREGWRDTKRGEVSQRLTKLGGEHHFFNFKNKGVNVWWVPDAVIQPNPPTETTQMRSEII